MFLFGIFFGIVKIRCNIVGTPQIDCLAAKETWLNTDCCYSWCDHNQSNLRLAKPHQEMAAKQLNESYEINEEVFGKYALHDPLIQIVVLIV